jgi:hypothetical protein
MSNITGPNRPGKSAGPIDVRNDRRQQIIEIFTRFLDACDINDIGSALAAGRDLRAFGISVVLRESHHRKGGQ